MARWNFICQVCFYERINDGRYLPDELHDGSCVLCGSEFDMGTFISGSQLKEYRDEVSATTLAEVNARSVTDELLQEWTHSKYDGVSTVAWDELNRRARA
jgi:hypothetical protein